MIEEIRQGDKVVLSSEDGFSVPMIGTEFYTRAVQSRNSERT